MGWQIILKNKIIKDKRVVNRAKLVYWIKVSRNLFYFYLKCYFILITQTKTNFSFQISYILYFFLTFCFLDLRLLLFTIGK